MAINVEVITIGGGEYIVNVFNAVAAWTDAGGYRGMLQVVLIMAFAMSLMILTFNSDVRTWLKWFFQSTLMYLCLMVPPANVQVVDRVNPDLKASAISNVPAGLAVIASFTSQMGDYLVRASEVVFSMPDDLNYSRNGMIYGSRLLEATQGLSINNPYFATNLDEYYRQCTFYDLQLGLKSWKEISEAPDVWTAVGTGARARSMPFIQMDSATPATDVVSCEEGYTKLTAAWNGVTDGMASRISRRFYPELTAGAAKAKLLADLPVAYQYLIGVSKDASELMKQTLAVNAMQQAIATQAGASGGSSDAYAQTRAQIQTRKTYDAVSHNAKEWVPILNIVLTVVFYALFPILFPLFLMPTTGVATLKGYVMGFFYLAAWGPIYVILNMIVTLRQHRALAGTENALSILTFNDISQVNSNTSVLAGYLMASIPFIAAGMAKGAMAIASHSTSFLAPSQNAAEEAGREASTGNIAFGNTSLDNLSFNNRQMSGWSTAGSYHSGEAVMSNTASHGATTSTYRDGSSSVEVPMSKLPFSAQLTKQAESTVSNVASNFKAQGERSAETAREATSAMLQNFSRFEKGFTQGSSTSLGIGHNTASTIREGLGARDGLSSLLQERHGLSKADADNVATTKVLGGQVGFAVQKDFKIPKGVPVVGGTKLTPSIGAQGSLNKQWQDALSSTRTTDLGALNDTVESWDRTSGWDKTDEGFRRAVSETTSSSLSSSARGVTASLSRSVEAGNESSRYMEAGSRLEKSYGFRDSDGVSSAIMLTDPFRNYVDREMTDPASAPLYRNDQNIRFDPGKREDYTSDHPIISQQRERLMGRFFAEYQKGVEAKAAQFLVEPPMDVKGPSVTTTAGVERAGQGFMGSVGSAQGGSSGQSIRDEAGAVVDRVEQRQGSAAPIFDDAVAGARARGLGVKDKSGDVSDQVDRETAPSSRPSPIGRLRPQR